MPGINAARTTCFALLSSYLKSLVLPAKAEQYVSQRAAGTDSPRVTSIHRTPLGSSLMPLRERTTLTSAAGSMVVSG